MPRKMKHKISAERINQLKSLLSRVKIDPKQFLIKERESKLEVINEALTHTSARVAYNHEKLEFLGDAVLRLAASEFIDNEFPKMQVGERSILRSQLVSDSWLTQVGKSIRIEELLIIGPKAAGDDAALGTLQAEATEALIGAIYECLKSLKEIKKWLYPYWQETSMKVLEDPYRQNSKSALQEWCQGNHLPLPTYELEEFSRKHADPKRFFCRVKLEDKILGEGWGGSRKIAEKEGAKIALQNIHNYNHNEKIN